MLRRDAAVFGGHKLVHRQKLLLVHIREGDEPLFPTWVDEQTVAAERERLPPIGSDVGGEHIVFAPLTSRAETSREPQQPSHHRVICHDTHLLLNI